MRGPRIALAGGMLALACAASAQSPCPRGDLPAYSHNDYENARPLSDALTLRYRGVEADVFLVDGVLRVGHDRRAARAGGTLEATYLAPLDSLVARCATLTSDGRPFFLAIEIKESSPVTYDSLAALLARHRAMLGKRATLDVVLVGWHPTARTAPTAIDTLIGFQLHLTRRDGAELRDVDSRVRLLSLDYGKTMGRWWVSPADRGRWLAALRAAKARMPGRLLRVHDVPVDRRIYAQLLGAGVDLIGTKRLSESARVLASMPPTPRPR